MCTYRRVCEIALNRQWILRNTVQTILDTEYVYSDYVLLFNLLVKTQDPV